MNTLKINALTRNIKNALVMNIKRERPDLAVHFSEYALAEIAKNEIAQCSRFTDSLDFLTDMCITTMENQLKTTRENQKELLQNCLEDDCEYPLEVIAEMTPRQKINNYLIWNGIEGFTDNILDAISAAYDIILKRT
jgi:hypothetical protein